MYTAFSYVKGTVGWGTKYDPTPGIFNGAPVAGGKWLLNFGKGLTCWVLAPHLVGMITVTNQTYYVSYRVPTFLMPGKYAVCLRGKVDFHNNYVNANLAADIYGFNAAQLAPECVAQCAWLDKPHVPRAQQPPLKAHCPRVAERPQR